MLTQRLAIGLRTGVVALLAVVALSPKVLATTLPVVRQFPAPSGFSEGMTVVGTELWVWEIDEPDLFHVVNPDSGAVLASHPSPSTGGLTGLAFDGTSIWGVSASYPPYVAELSPSDGSVVRMLPPLVASPSGITYDGRYLWIADNGAHQLVAVNPLTLDVVRSIPCEPRLTADLAWDGHTLWLSGYEQPSEPGGDWAFSLYQIEPNTGATLGSFDVPGKSAAGLVVLGNELFVSDVITDTIYVLSIPEPAAIGSILTGFALMMLKRVRPVFATERH